MFRAIADGFGYLYDLLISLSTRLLNGLLWLLQPIFDVIVLIIGLIYWIGQIAFKVIALVIGVGKLLVGLVAGLFSTILGFGYTGRVTNLPSSYHQVYDNISPILRSIQLDKFAYLLQFALWFATGFIALRIIGNMRGGGGGD